MQGCSIQLAKVIFSQTKDIHFKMRYIRVLLPLFKAIHEAPELPVKRDSCAACGHILRSERKMYLISHGVGCRRHLHFLTTFFMKFILIANTKQLREPLPGLSGENSEVPATGLLPLALCMTAERSFAHSWFPYIQDVAHLTVSNTHSRAVWGWTVSLPSAAIAASVGTLWQYHLWWPGTLDPEVHVCWR